MLTAALLMAMTLHAQEKKEPLKTNIPATETNLRLAAELSKYGYANKSAIALVQAAQMAVENGFKEEPAKKEGGQADNAGAGKKSSISLNPTQLLSDAKKLADGDANLLALIEKTSATAAKRGPVGGAKYNSTNVKANGADVYYQNFIAGSTAVVTAVGDGDTDLDLYVYDSNGNLIAKDDDYTDNCVVSWTPKWTGKFRIRVVNRGGVSNNYVIRMR